MNPYNICTDDNTVMKFVKLSNKATTPMRGSKHAAGIDLFSAERKEISPGGRCVIKTDIAIMIPKGTYARIAPRSSLAVAHGIHVGAGVVDFDYVGNVSVVLFNHSDNNFSVEPGMRICQLILEKICTPSIIEVEQLKETQRADCGFGSTNVLTQE